MVVQERDPVGTAYEDIEPSALIKARSRLRRVFQRFINSSARETGLGFKEIEAGNYTTLEELKSKVGVE